MQPITGKTLVGHVTGLIRYPVKSMRGESLDYVTVGENGLAGDRQYAVIDVETGLVASAKKPSKWGKLTHINARLVDQELVISLENGEEFRSGKNDLDAVLSQVLGRKITICMAENTPKAIEMDWPAVAELNVPGKSTTEELRPGSFFDLAPIHLITSATLDRFEEVNSQSTFSLARFRPNIMLKTLSDLTGFVENDWIGKSLHIGGASIKITARCSRCVMTTLAQGNLAADPAVLRAIAKQNSGNLGAYAVTTLAGEISEGDEVWLS